MNRVKQRNGNYKEEEKTFRRERTEWETREHKRKKKERVGWRFGRGKKSKLEYEKTTKWDRYGRTFEEGKGKAKVRDDLANTGKEKGRRGSSQEEGKGKSWDEGWLCEIKRKRGFEIENLRPRRQRFNRQPFPSRHTKDSTYMIYVDLFHS